MVKKSLRLHELGLPFGVDEAARASDEFSPQAQATILDFIQGCEVQLSDIQSRIAVLQLPMQWHMRQDLRNEEEIAQDRLRSCRGLLSAMRRIPVEVMGEIFQLYLAPGGSLVDDEDDSDHDESDHDSEGQHVPVESKPALLCLVCRRWYEITMTTSRLWRNVTAWVVGERSGNPPGVRLTDVPGFLKCVDRFKSQHWSLTVSPRSGSFRYYDGSRNSTLLASFLLEHPASQHLQRLAICADMFVIGLGDLTFPRVISVTVSSPRNLRFFRMFGLPSLPSLTQAVFANVIELHDIPANIPWSQLTHLCLGGNVSSRHWRRIFKLCTSLERGVFSTTEGPVISEVLESTPLNQTVFPHLTQLDFVNSMPSFRADDDDVGISLPSLTKLRLFSNFMQSSWNFSPALFGRVTHLTFICNPMSGEESLVETLSNFPHLRELFIGLGDADFEEVFGFLKVGGDGTCHLPFLEALGVWIMSDCCADDEPPDFPYQLFEDLVTSRTKALQDSGVPGTDSSAVPTPVAVGLRQLVLQVDRWSGNDVVEEVVLKLREATREFTDYGLRTSVIQVGGTTPLRWGGDWTRLVDTMKHWDEGIMGFLDGATEFGSYPLDESLRSNR